MIRPQSPQVLRTGVGVAHQWDGISLGGWLWSSFGWWPAEGVHLWGWSKGLVKPEAISSKNIVEAKTEYILNMTWICNRSGTKTSHEDAAKKASDIVQLHRELSLRGLKFNWQYLPKFRSIQLWTMNTLGIVNTEKSTMDFWITAHALWKIERVHCFPHAFVAKISSGAQGKVTASEHPTHSVKGRISLCVKPQKFSKWFALKMSDQQKWVENSKRMVIKQVHFSDIPVPS